MSRLMDTANEGCRSQLRAAFSGLEVLKRMPELVGQGAAIDRYWETLEGDCGVEELGEGIETLGNLIAEEEWEIGGFGRE